MDKIIVGAGLSGCVIARRLADMGHKVTIIEKRDHIGGNCYDYMNDDGILVPKYGIHCFHTNDKRVWEFVNRFSEWLPYEHLVMAVVDGELIPLPPLKEYADKVIKGYTKKQWGRYADKLKPEVTARIKVREEYDDDIRYFKDEYQAMPRYGYTKMFEKMLEGINVQLNTDFFSTGLECDFYSGRPDEYFSYCFGKLPYRSLRFEHKTLDKQFFQPVAQVNYPQTKKYTRILEPKHNNMVLSSKTTIIKEYPTWRGEPYYPVPTVENEALAKEYYQPFFIGRLATYKYINMDEAIRLALEKDLTRI